MLTSTRAAIALLVIAALLPATLLWVPHEDVIVVTPDAEVFDVCVSARSWSELMNVPKGRQLHLQGISNAPLSLAVFTMDAYDSFSARGGGRPEPMDALYGVTGKWAFKVPVHESERVVIVDNSSSDEPVTFVMAVRLD